MSIWWWVLIVGVLAGVPSALAFLTVRSLSDEIKALTAQVKRLLSEEDP